MEKIKLKKQQILALNKGATMLWIQCTDYDHNRSINGFSLGDSVPALKDTEYYVSEPIYDNKEFVWNQMNVLRASPSTECNEDEARIKFKVLNNKVRRSQEISHNKGEIYKMYPDAHQDGYDNFMHGFNDKFLDGKYEENLTGFLIEIEILS